MATYLGQRYFLTLVDDHSRFTWTYLLSRKSNAATIIPEFFALVETQFNRKVKIFRSDNAPKLALTEFLASKGTLHQFSCVERPQQNATVERKHQNLLNMARSIFFQSTVPISFLGRSFAGCNIPYQQDSYFCTYDRLSPTYKSFYLQVSSLYEPQFYHQTAKFPK